MGHWEAYGPERGSCGHKHRTKAAAEKCAENDCKGIAALNRSGFYNLPPSDRFARELEESDDKTT